MTGQTTGEYTAENTTVLNERDGLVYLTGFFLFSISVILRSKEEHGMQISLWPNALPNISENEETVDCPLVADTVEYSGGVGE